MSDTVSSLKYPEMIIKSSRQMGKFMVDLEICRSDKAHYLKHAGISTQWRASPLSGFEQYDETRKDLWF